MAKLTSLKSALAVLVLAGPMAGCDTDYDATADLRTEEESEQIATDQSEPGTAEEPYSYDARNPGFDYGAPDDNIQDNEQQPAQLGAANARAQETVYFPPDLATLNQDEENDLRQFAEYIREQDLSGMQISIESYAASSSTEEYDKQLSELRAEAVRDFLESQGINVANWDLKTLGSGKLPETAMQDKPKDSSSAVTDGMEQETTPAPDSNRVVVSVVPLSGQDAVS